MTSLTRELMSRLPRLASATPVDRFGAAEESTGQRNVSAIREHSNDLRRCFSSPIATASWCATSSIESTPYDSVPRCSFFISISVQENER